MVPAIFCQFKSYAAVEWFLRNCLIHTFFFGLYQKKKLSINPRKYWKKNPIKLECYHNDMNDLEKGI